MPTTDRYEIWPWGILVPAGFLGWWLFRQPGKYFTWEELTTTTTGLPNTPTLMDRVRMIIFARRVLDPIREVVGPVAITSAFRSPAVNDAVGGAGGECHGGSGCSQHTVGYGADIVTDYSNDDVAEMLFLQAIGPLPLAQVITYADTNHLHLGFDPGGMGPTEFLEHQSDGSYTNWTP